MPRAWFESFVCGPTALQLDAARAAGRQRSRSTLCEGGLAT